MSIDNEKELEFGDDPEENEAAEREFFEKMKVVFQNLRDFYTTNKEGCGSKSSFQDIAGNLITLLAVAFAGDFDNYCEMKEAMLGLKEKCVERIRYFQKYQVLLKDTDIFSKERGEKEGAFPELRKQAAKEALGNGQTPNLMYIDLMWKEKFGSFDS